MGPETVDAEGLQEAPRASIVFEAPCHVVWSRWVPYYSPHELAVLLCADRPKSAWQQSPEASTRSVSGGWTHERHLVQWRLLLQSKWRCDSRTSAPAGTASAGISSPSWISGSSPQVYCFCHQTLRGCILRPVLVYWIRT